MAFADDDPPFPTADLDRHPVGKPPKARRHRRDTAAIAVFPLAEELDRCRVEPRTMSKTAAQRGKILVAAAHHPGEQPFLFGNPQGCLPVLCEPARQPDMVGMVMRHDDPGDRQSAEPLGKDSLPQLLGWRHRIAGIDDRPTRAVFEEPQIDVVEREGERHAQPVHTRGDRQGLPGRRRRRNRKLQRCQASVHKLGVSRLVN